MDDVVEQLKSIIAELDKDLDSAKEKIDSLENELFELKEKEE